MWLKLFSVTFVLESQILALFMNVFKKSKTSIKSQDFAKSLLETICGSNHSLESLY